MTEQEIETFIKSHFPAENEACEWKDYKSLKQHICGSEREDVATYASALANMEGGNIVLGVEDKTLKVTGIEDFANLDTQSVKNRLTEVCINLPSEGLRIDEYRAEDTRRVVWVITIPKHSRQLMVYAHGKAWQRIGDSLVELTTARRDTILGETAVREDWSMAIVDDATMDDLDPKAIAKARQEFVKRNPGKSEESKTWDDAKFLNKARITIKGKITRTALLLLGKEASDYLLSPYVAKIRWSLRKPNEVQNMDYGLFSIPFILSVDKLYGSIRNVKYRLVRPDTLFPDEMLRYDMFNIREPLNNAIAHQDYEKCARIDVVEYDNDRLVFQNAGNFIPGSVEKVVSEDCPESVYRNPFLAEAMRNVNMIETEGGGIKKMFIKQKERFFPMPDYDLSDEKVKVTIYGKVMDENFARIVSAMPDMSLVNVMLLDKVQKGKKIDDESAHYLRRQKFIEGRKPNYYLSYNVVIASKDSALKDRYIKNRSFDDEYYMKLIVDYIKKFRSASRENIDLLLGDKLSDVLTPQQKRNKVGNLLKKLRVQDVIETSSEKRCWKLKDKRR